MLRCECSSRSDCGAEEEIWRFKMALSDVSKVKVFLIYFLIIPRDLCATYGRKENW